MYVCVGGVVYVYCVDLQDFRTYLAFSLATFLHVIKIQRNPEGLLKPRQTRLKTDTMYIMDNAHHFEWATGIHFSNVK